MRIHPSNASIRAGKLRAICSTLLILFLSWTAGAVHAGQKEGLSLGQTVYVPAYSHILIGNKEIQSLLAITLSIRNTDPNHPIKVASVNYYETRGRLLKTYLSSPLTLSALGTQDYTVPLNDKTGGSGANFIVVWQADRPVNPPIIETIMIGSRSSFTSRGQAIIPSD